MLAVSVGFVNRRMVFLRCQGYPGAARRLYRRAAWALGLLCLLAMLAQELMLLLSHQLSWRTGLPLHLCSAMGVLMLPTLLTGNESLRHAALYLGVPGALAALLFPAILSTPWPRGMALAFHALHASLAVAPWLPFGLGWRPKPIGAVQAGAVLGGLGCAAAVANRLTGGNYLFLSTPVAGTPLMLLARHGLGAYRAWLALLCAGALFIQAAAVCLWGLKKAGGNNG